MNTNSKIWKDQQSFLGKLKAEAPDDFDKALNISYKEAQMLGLEGDDAAKYITEHTLARLNVGGKNGNKSVEQRQKHLDSLVKRQENIYKRLAESTSDEEKQTLQGELAEVQTRIKEIDDQLDETFNLPRSQPTPAYTGNEKEDIKILSERVRYMRANGASDEEIFKAVRAWVDETDKEVTDWFIQNLIKKAQAD